MHVIINPDNMKCFFIRYNGQDTEVYADDKGRKSVFAIHLQTGPVMLSVDTYADGSEHWQEEEYGATQLAAELGSLIEEKMNADF